MHVVHRFIKAGDAARNPAHSYPLPQEGLHVHSCSHSMPVLAKTDYGLLEHLHDSKIQREYIMWEGKSIKRTIYCAINLAKRSQEAKNTQVSSRL